MLLLLLLFSLGCPFFYKKNAVFDKLLIEYKKKCIIRFAIDTMQSVCLDEFGGEKAVHPRAQETTFIQHIFGGHLQSQVAYDTDNVKCFLFTLEIVSF